MSINDYLEKLRTKPVRERERIAVIATGIAFVIIFLIWVVSFNEMNKSAQPEAENQPAQLEDLKSNLGSDKASIEEMFQNLPQEGSLEEDNSDMGSDNTENNGNNLNNRNNESGGEIPQLP